MSVGDQHFDPYRKWLGIPAEEQPPHHYRLLGLRTFESDLDVISHAADRCMGHVRTFQSGSQVALCQRILNELAAARLCLLGANTKAQYDRQLQAALNSPGQVAPPTVDRVAPMATIATAPVTAAPVAAAPVTAVPVAAVAVGSAGQSPTVGIQTSPGSSGTRRRRRKKYSSAPVVLGCVACLLLLGGLLAVVIAKQGESARNKANENPRTIIIKVPAEQPPKRPSKKKSERLGNPQSTVPTSEPRYESSDRLYDSVDGRYRRRDILE